MFECERQVWLRNIAARSHESRFVSSSQAESVEGYLNEGLELFGLGRINEAIKKWRLVLAIAPTEPRALDYLAAAGVDPSVPELVDELGDFEVTAPIEILDVGFYRRRVAALVAEKKYEEALEVITEARRLDPGDQSLSRSMSLLKQHLGARYRARLGRLEEVVTKHETRCPEDIDPRVWILLDGITTIADIVELSPIGEFRTLRALCLMLDSGAVARGTRSDVAKEPATVKSNATKEPATVNRNPTKEPPTAKSNAYDDLFREASTCYLRRDYQKAIDLFELCLVRSPNDSRVIHNLAALRKRLPKS